jgi:hypothetical protein
LAGDLVGVVPGIAGGAQHGRPLLQLHLRQPRTGGYNAPPDL